MNAWTQQVKQLWIQISVLSINQRQNPIRICCGIQFEFFIDENTKLWIKCIHSPTITEFKHETKTHHLGQLWRFLFAWLLDCLHSLLNILLVAFLLCYTIRCNNHWLPSGAFLAFFLISFTAIISLLDSFKKKKENTKAIPDMMPAASLS